MNQANTDLNQIAAINTQLQGLGPNDPSAPTLENQRDSAINDLASLMDVKAITGNNNQTSIFTNTGVQLVTAGQASQFSFTSAGTLTANSLYNTDPTKSGVGSLTVKLPNGANIDVVANKVITSGRIAADLQLRDQTLVQAQTQVDQLAATLSSSLSDVTTQGTAVTSGSQSGFSLNVANLQPGNTINLTYTNNTTGAQQQVQIVNVTDPSALPLQNVPNANPQSDRGQFLRHHGFGGGAAQRGARPKQSAVFKSIRQHVAGGQPERGGDRQCGLRHDHDLVADQRQPAAAIVHRRRCAVYGRDHRQRLANDRACRTHHGQFGAAQ